VDPTDLLLRIGWRARERGEGLVVVRAAKEADPTENLAGHGDVPTLEGNGWLTRVRDDAVRAAVVLRGHGAAAEVRHRHCVLGVGRVDRLIRVLEPKCAARIAFETA
jgi:hypothetical protein